MRKLKALRYEFVITCGSETQETFFKAIMNSFASAVKMYEIKHKNNKVEIIFEEGLSFSNSQLGEKSYE